MSQYRLVMPNSNISKKIALLKLTRDVKNALKQYRNGNRKQATKVMKRLVKLHESYAKLNLEKSWGSFLNEINVRCGYIGFFSTEIQNSHERNNVVRLL